MSDTVTQIKVLIEASGKTAPAMTAALKKIGNGSMQTGITTVAHFFAKEGIKVGTIRGAIGGVAGTVAVGGLIWLVQKVIKDHQLHKEEGEAILKAFCYIRTFGKCKIFCKVYRRTLAVCDSSCIGYICPSTG